MTWQEPTLGLVQGFFLDSRVLHGVPLYLELKHPACNSRPSPNSLQVPLCDRLPIVVTLL